MEEDIIEVLNIYHTKLRTLLLDKTIGNKNRREKTIIGTNVLDDNEMQELAKTLTKIDSMFIELKLIARAILEIEIG